MQVNEIGRITKITGAKVLVRVTVPTAVNHIGVESFLTSYISVGSLVETRLVDGRLLVMTVEEIYDSDADIFVSSSISGIFDEVTEKFTFGTNTYPLVGEQVFKLWNKILEHIFAPTEKAAPSTIGTYIYDSSVKVGYNPNVLFGKHLGVYGNTGSGKTCTVVSVIQNYIRENPEKDIKFIILDVNGEYRTAFRKEEYEYYEFDSLRLNHTILNIAEYGRLFRTSEATQFPAIRDSISVLSNRGSQKWDLKELPRQLNAWVEKSKVSDFNKNQLMQYLQTLFLRVESILDDAELMAVINSDEDNTLRRILKSDKKVHILDLQVSIDALDIVLYLLFKTIYQYKVEQRKEEVPDPTHLNLVLEEAHRYINADLNETKLGSYYIDKLSREGRKFGIGLVISSQVPSMLSYEIVSQCNSVIMHKITSKRDMEFLRGVLRISNDAFYLQMSALEKQHAIVCGEAFPNDSIVKIHDAYPLPQSNDPVIDDIPFGKRAPHSEPERFGIIELGEIGMPDEKDEWDELIEQLLESPNFLTTHSLITKLTRNNYWTARQVDELCRAVIDNSQVGWVIGDSDICSFYRCLLADITDRTGHLKTVYDMVFEAKEDQKGNNWKELEAEQVIGKELERAQSILDNNPVLQFSPGDLRREGRTVEEYLSSWTPAQQQKYRDYYEDEL